MKRILLVAFSAIAMTAIASATVVGGCVNTGGVDMPAGMNLNGAFPYALETGPVYATYLGSESCYNNTLRVGNVDVFNNHTTPVGTTVFLGDFLAGEIIPISMYVANTGLTYFPGPGDANPDGAVHFGFWATSGGLEGGAEDLPVPNFEFNSDRGDDFAWKMSNTTVNPIPEPGTIALFGSAAAIFAARHFRRRRRA